MAITRSKTAFKFEHFAKHIKYALAAIFNLYGRLTPCCMPPMSHKVTEIITSRDAEMDKVKQAVVGDEIAKVQQQEEEEEMQEWDVEFDEGVMVTLVAYPHAGCNRMKRIRFRKGQFCPAKARAWWVENSDKVMDLFNIQRSDLDRYISVMVPQESNPMQETSSIWGEENRTALALSEGGSCSSHGDGAKKNSASSMASAASPCPSMEVSSGPSLAAWEMDRDQPGVRIRWGTSKAGSRLHIR